MTAPPEPGPAGPSKARRGLAALALGFLLFVLYSLNGQFLPGNDASGNVFVPVSFLNEGNVTFTPHEMPWMFVWRLKLPTGIWDGPIANWKANIRGVPLEALYRQGALTPLEGRYFVTKTRRTTPAGEPVYLASAGVVTGLTALPVYAAAHLLQGDLREHLGTVWFAGKAAASLCVALSAVFLFLLLSGLTEFRLAWFAALIYGLATCVWSVSSQTLWQHGPNELYLAAGLYFWWLAKRDGRPMPAVLSGLAFGAAAACRPPSIFVLAAASVAALLDKRLRWYFIAGALPPVAVQGFINWYYLGSALTNGQGVSSQQISQRVNGSSSLFQTPLYIGLPGLLISPSRGLFVFSPIFLFSLPGLAAVWKVGRFHFLRPFLVGSLAVLLLQSMFYDWWGGYTFGYRPIVDLCIFLIPCLIPVLEKLRSRPALRAVFAAALVWSIAVQIIGGWAYEIHGWNERAGIHLQLPSGQETVVPAGEQGPLLAQGARPLGPQLMPIWQPPFHYRLWSLRDSQLVFSLTHWGEVQSAKNDAVQGIVSNAVYPAPMDLADIVEADLARRGVLK